MKKSTDEVAVVDGDVGDAVLYKDGLRLCVLGGHQDVHESLCRPQPHIAAVVAPDQDLPLFVQTISGLPFTFFQFVATNGFLYFHSC